MLLWCVFFTVIIIIFSSLAVPPLGSGSSMSTFNLVVVLSRGSLPPLWSTPGVDRPPDQITVTSNFRFQRAGHVFWCGDVWPIARARSQTQCLFVFYWSLGQSGDPSDRTPVCGNALTHAKYSMDKHCMVCSS